MPLEVPDCDELSVEQKVGQLLCAGCITGGLGSRVEEFRALLSRGLLGGIYTGYPHFKSPYDALRLHEDMQRASRYAAFIAGDLENGLAYNIESGCCHFTYLMGLGAVGSEEMAFQVGKTLGREARHAGFNFHFGPCVDLSLRLDNPITGIRSFGGDPEAVGRLAAAYIRGVQSEHVICSAKHFPGAGDSAGDSHNVVCTLERSEEQLAQRELTTFAAAIEAGVKTVMTGHLAVPSVDGSGAVATMSRGIVERLLRNRLGFDGLAITDSMAMGAVSGMTPREMCLRAFKAGHDLILIPNPEQARQDLLKALAEGEISEQEVDRRARRVLELKRWMCRDDYSELRSRAPSVFLNADTLRLMRRQAREAVTVATPGSARRRSTSSRDATASLTCSPEKGRLWSCWPLKFADRTRPGGSPTSRAPATKKNRRWSWKASTRCSPPARWCCSASSRTMPATPTRDSSLPVSGS